MFMGEYNHTIDAKGRLIVPAKFREQLGEAFVITNGNDGCLNIYTNEDWETFLGKLQLLPNNRDKREIVRKFVAQANMVEIDKQGRINLSRKALLPGGEDDRPERSENRRSSYSGNRNNNNRSGNNNKNRQ